MTPIATLPFTPALHSAAGVLLALCPTRKTHAKYIFDNYVESVAIIIQI